jgi:hypothetical protein
MNFNFPLQFKFSFWLGVEVDVSDSQYNQVAYIKQKLFDFREHTEIFTSSDKSQKMFNIRANNIIDWTANYIISDNEQTLGYVRRHGFASLWKATYQIYDNNDRHIYTIQENNGFIKILDSMLSQIPVLNLLSGFLFNPSYSIRDLGGKVLYNLSKTPSFFSREFKLSDESNTSIDNPELVFCSLIQMLCLERDRG